MKAGISNVLLSRLSDLVTDQTGLYFPVGRWSDLERGIRAAAREFGMPEVPAFIEWLLSTPLTREQVAILARDLTVGETYFLREKKTWDALGDWILPGLIHARRGERRLRLWSAGCCTGEEAYSLAIVVQRNLPDWQDWNITLLATDLNPGFLRKAAAGTYGEWSFRDAPAWLKETCFRPAPAGQWEILPAIKKMVTFTCLNLAEDAYPSLLNDTNAMDLILCRNVLMYFAPEPARKVIHHLHRALVEGGWLAVGASESSHLWFPQFVAVNQPGAIFFRKETEPVRTAAASQGPTVKIVPAKAPAGGRASPPRPAVSAERHFEEAQGLYQAGRYAEAVAVLRELNHRQTLEPRVLMLLARACANQGELAEALKWCDQAIAADKLQAGGYYLRATILQEQGAADQAVHSLRRALYLDPRFVVAHFDLGNLAWRRGQPAEARRHMERALRLLTGHPPDSLVPETEGLTAGRLVQIIRSQLESEVAA